MMGDVQELENWKNLWKANEEICKKERKSSRGGGLCLFLQVGIGKLQDE
jgi:hypothetical protein